MKGTKTTLNLLLSLFVASATAFTGEDLNGLPMGGFKAPQVAPKSSWFSWLPSKAGITQGFVNFGSSAKKRTSNFYSKVTSSIPTVDKKTAGIYGGAIGAGLAAGYAIQKGIIGKTCNVVKTGCQKTVNGIKAANQKYPKAKWAGLATGVVTAAGLGVLAYRNPELVTSAFDIAKTVGSKVADIAVKASNLVVDNKYPAATFAGSAVAVPGLSAANKWYQNRKSMDTKGDTGNPDGVIITDCDSDDEDEHESSFGHRRDPQPYNFVRKAAPELQTRNSQKY